MKKCLIIIVLVLCLTSFFNVKAAEIDDKLNAASTSADYVLTYLDTWINDYPEAVNYLVNREAVSVVNSNYVQTVNNIINYLKSGGYTTAAIALENAEIASYIAVIVDAEDAFYNYLNNESPEYATVSIVRNMLLNSEDKLTKIYNALIDTCYTNIVSQIDISYAGMLDYLDSSISAVITVVNTIQGDIDRWQNLYNEKYYGYERIYPEYNSYLSKFNSAYARLYNKVYNKYKQMLDDKVLVIDNAVDKTSSESVKTHNNDIYTVMEQINTIKSKLNEHFTTINSYVKMQFVLDLFNEKENAIISQLNVDIDEVESHLLNYVEVKEDNLSSNESFIIDNFRQLMVYKGTDLNVNNFTSKLSTDFTSLNANNTYNGKVGTASVISVYYNDIEIGQILIVVKGDIYADGNISALDAVQIRNQIMDVSQITGELYTNAADCNDDGKISALDAVYIRNIIMNGGA